MRILRVLAGAQSTARFSRQFRNFSSIPTQGPIFVTGHIPRNGVDLLEKNLGVENVVYNDSEEPLPRAKLLEKVEGVSGILCLLNDKIDAELLDVAGGNLKTVSTLSVGYDHIDIKECNARNVSVGNTPGVLTNTTADLCVALLLATARNIGPGIQAVRDGSWTTWKSEWLCGPEVTGSTIGIHGLGRIGQAFAKRMKAFDCRILYSGRREKPEEAREVGAEFVDFHQLLAESDFVVPHCPLNPETTGLFGQESFLKMKSSAIFINTTRGGVVDQEALYNALKEGVIAGAGLDVTSPEPLPTDHPLLTLPNCTILPHLGSSALPTRQKMSIIAAENLMRGLRGEPLRHRVQV